MAIGGQPRALRDQGRRKGWLASERYSNTCEDQAANALLRVLKKLQVTSVMQGVSQIFVHQYHYIALWLEKSCQGISIKWAF